MITLLNILNPLMDIVVIIIYILTLENALSWLSNDVIIVNDISIDYDVDEEAIEKIGRGFSQSCLN